MGGDFYLRVRGRHVPATVDAQQRAVGERQVELDVGGVVHGHVEAPEESWRDGLALLGAHVHLAPVDGSAAHPLLCTQTGRGGGVMSGHRHGSEMRNARRTSNMGLFLFLKKKPSGHFKYCG